MARSRAAGAVMIGTGCVFLVLGLLRMVQNEFGKTFRGSWMTMLPYLFAFVASLAIMGIAAWRISKKKTLQKGSAMMAQQRITRDDLESRFRQLQDNVQGRVDDKKSTLATVGAVGGIVLLLIFFFLGKRRGKKKTTLVEIRRV